MTQQQKIQIIEELERMIALKGSQNALAAAMKIAPATISKIRRHDWDTISDEMWRKVAAFVGSSQDAWVIAHTRNSTDLLHFFSDAKTHSLVLAITGRAGSGKTETAKQFASEHPSTYLLSCNEYWDKRWFLRELLAQMGRDHAGLTLPEMMQKCVQLLKSTHQPLIILDEADKLADNVLLFFITLYNELENHCGIILMATHFLEKRIRRGAAMEKKGYREIFSRVGLRFIELEYTSFADVEAVCKANGIEDAGTIRSISRDCDGDIRRVRRLIFATKRQLKNED